MKKERNKLGIIGEIYSHFTEKNKENLVKSATSLLKVQKEDAERVAADPSLKNEKQS